MKRCDRILLSEADSDLRSAAWRLDRGGYCMANINRKDRLAHRVVMERVAGRPLIPSEFVDHINFDKQDNRRENLRLVTKSESAQHKLPQKHKYRGVTFIAKVGKWQAQVGHNGKSHYCGLHATIEQAGAAAKRKRVELGFFGESEAA